MTAKILKLKSFIERFIFRELEFMKMAESIGKTSEVETEIIDECGNSLNSTAKKRRLDESVEETLSNEKIDAKRVKTDGPVIESKSKRNRIREKTGPVLDKPEFYFENGLRKVRPYWFRFVTYAKGRWLGRNLIDVLHEELYTKDPSFFDEQIKLGRLTVNDKAAVKDYVLKESDVIKNVMHRHEMPVLDKPIEILVNDEEVVVVNKPCSIPTHSCGRYYFNSLMYILQHEFGVEGLKVVHRLDRLTSGLIIFPKSAQKAKELASQIANNEVSKQYVCRVEGVFPDEELMCDRPIGALCQKMGVHWVTADGKPSRTRFQKIFSSDNESVVRCLPETGRTHQIRVHLQYLGYPIANDIMYNNAVFGARKGKGGDYGKSHEQLRLDVANTFCGASWVDDFDAVLSTYLDKRPTSSADAPTAIPDSSSPYYDPHCVDCHMKSRDPSVEQLQMYLHCLKYDGPNWSYSTPLPEWAIPSDDTV